MINVVWPKLGESHQEQPGSAHILPLRFRKAEIRRILPFLQLETEELRARYTATPEERLCLVLMRLAYPIRIKDLCDVFGRSPSWVSTVLNDTLIHMYGLWHDRLGWNPEFLTLDRVRSYQEAIDAVGGGDCHWGYIDGTMSRVCRPELDQKLMYSGHKKTHCLKYQGITTPDGLVASFTGPYVGSKADPFMVTDSGLPEKLQEVGPPPVFSQILMNLAIS